MANEKNLKTPSASEARERGKKGGKASGAARRERKQLRDELLALLSDGDTQEKMCLALIRQAQRGNIKAFEVVRDTIGESPSNVDKNAPGVTDEINENLISIAKLINNPRPNRKLPEDDEN